MVERMAQQTRLLQQGPETEFTGATARHVAMPLGGLGAGQIALGADGGLRQWQIVNQINHVGFVPDSFFAIRATAGEPPRDELRILQSREILDRPSDPTLLVNDDQIPADQHRLLETAPGVDRTLFRGPYPFARIRYEDERLPVEVELEAYSPFVPLDADASGLPAILFSFTMHNTWPHRVSGCLAAALQNAVGWDGLTPISGNRCPLYGGNTNRLRRRSDSTSIVMDNPALPEDHPGAGQMVLTAISSDARPYERWAEPAQFIRFLEGFNPTSGLAGHDFAKERAHRNAPVPPVGPSPAGTTWNGGLAIPFWLHPDETATFTFVLAWHFPNRYLNFDQFGREHHFGRSRFWLGNAYATRFGDAVDVSDHVLRHRGQLDEESRAWERVLCDTTLPGWLVGTLAAQGSLMRSPTCFWTEDGKFFGFEGSLGASTGMWNGTFGGSCPLNCTHVWNYEMALAKLFPALERTMRETDFEVAQAPEGYIPHRTIAPLYLKQLWDEPIGGPTNPALDGMLGTILKTYREVRVSGDSAWLDRLWPRVHRLLTYTLATWDENGDGVLEGEQPNTYDIAFYGPNMYIGALWLAALRAGEEMANLQGDTAFAQTLRERFELGSANYDQLLWNGEYYIQILDETTPLEDQFGTGCLADQLFGQWWAHLLDLGHVLPETHVKATLRSIVQHNMREGFAGFEHDYRVFADRDDTGLLICTWPQGGRPEVPIRYCDEVWTGIEYQVAAHCIMEGMVEEGLEMVAALRRRYDGTRRNPYNEIECGDHYARAMAGWSVLEALAGFRYDATTDTLRFHPAGSPTEFRAPVVLSSGWGTFDQTQNGSTAHVSLSCAHGEMRVRSLTLGASAAGSARVRVNDLPSSPEVTRAADGVTFSFAEPVILTKGDRLTCHFQHFSS